MAPPTGVVLYIFNVGGATRGEVLGVVERLKESRRVGPPTGVVLYIFDVGGATRGEVLGMYFKIKSIAASGPSYRGGALNL